MACALALPVGAQPVGPGRVVNPADIELPPGYRIEAVATGLSYATDVAFGDRGEVYVAEAGGHTYGTSPEEAPPPRILQLLPGGGVRVVYASSPGLEVVRNARNVEEIPEGLIAPITGITWHDGLLYVSHRTRVSTLDPATGEFRTIIQDLPAWGEFQNNKVIFGPDGLMYFFVSTQGNSGPVDDHILKVLTAYNKPNQHEVPCEDVALTGQDFTHPNPFTPDPNDTATYDAYVPFGVNVPPGTVIPGRLKCNGAFYRAFPDGSGLEVIAWGLRSNFGYRFDRSGRLISSMNSGNPIPPREIFDDWETIWEIRAGEWYGWPDYYSGLPVTHPRFQRPTGAGAEQFQPLDFVLTEETRRRLLRGRAEPIQPLVRLYPHVSAEGFVFGRADFGVPDDEILLAEFGTVVTYLAQELPGFRVQRVNLTSGQVSDFAVNRTGKPASETGGGGLERPIQLAWGPDGALYIVDFGVIHVSPSGLNAEPNTAVIWRVTRDIGIAAQPTVGVDQILASPARFIGQRTPLTFTATVERALGPRSFLVRGPAGGLLPIVARQPLLGAGGRVIGANTLVGQQVRVTGTLDRFDLIGWENALGVDLDDPLWAPFVGRPAVIATNVIGGVTGLGAVPVEPIEPITRVAPGPAVEPVDELYGSLGLAPGAVPLAGATVDDILDYPTAYARQYVSVAGEVGEVLSGRSFTLEDEDLFFEEELLVIGAREFRGFGPIVGEGGAFGGEGGIGAGAGFAAGEEVRVNGFVSTFSLRAFEREFGADLDDALYGEWEGRPALIATEVLPAAGGGLGG